MSDNSGSVVGMEDAHERVLSFLERIRQKSKRAGQTLTATLHQVGFGQSTSDEPINVFYLEPGDPSAAATAQDLVDNAQHVAEGMVGAGFERVSFMVKVEGEGGVSNFSLRIQEDEGEDGDDPWAGPAPVASQKAAMGMFMQHTQVLVKELRSQSSDANRLLQRENVELRRENAELRRERVKFYALYEQMHQNVAEREVRAQQAQAETRMKERLAERAGDAVVPLVNGLLGSRLLKAKDGKPDTPLEAAVADLGKSLSPEQKMALVGSDLFNEKQKILLMTIVSAVESASVQENTDAQPPANGEASGFRPQTSPERGTS